MERTIPSEFAGFVRDVAVRALDRLSERAKEFSTAPRAVLRAWSKLSDDQKGELIGQLIADAQGEGPPAKKRAAKSKPKKKT